VRITEPEGNRLAQLGVGAKEKAHIAAGLGLSVRNDTEGNLKTAGELIRRRAMPGVVSVAVPRPSEAGVFDRRGGIGRSPKLVAVYLLTPPWRRQIHPHPPMTETGQ